MIAPPSILTPRVRLADCIPSSHANLVDGRRRLRPRPHDEAAGAIRSRGGRTNRSNGPWQGRA
jgi:hypothetical protein